ncbi:MAG: F0F1 ATP synthase subunit A [Verrucomicrobiia bacterium]
MKSFGVITLACVFFAAICAVTLHAQSSGSPAPAAVGVTATPAADVPEASAKPIVSQSALTLFHLGPLPVTNSMICTWIAAALIFLIVRLTTWKVKELPTAGQNIMEALIEGWESLMGNVLEPKVTRWVFPMATTFFIFILISNLMDLLPGVGSIGMGYPDKTSALPFAVEHVEMPFFRPPTTDANLTVVMAGIFFVMSLFWAVRYNGPWGLVKHIFGVKVATNKWAYVPLFLLFIFIGIMESFSVLFIRPVALALRLYGNIFGGETMLTMAMTQKSFFLAVLLALPGYFFELVVCVLQAFVFAMLSVAFVGTLCTHMDEEGAH